MENASFLMFLSCCIIGACFIVLMLVTKIGITGGI